MTIDVTGYYLEDLSIGQTAAFSKTVSEADILLFAGVSGDTNPVHINQAYAETTVFQGRVAHGMLSAAIISAVMGTKLPGAGAIYLSQMLRFRAPVRIGDTVTAIVTVREIVADKQRVVLETIAQVGDRVVIEGEAVLRVPSRNNPKDRR